MNTEAKLEYKLLFAVIVAGKSAKFARSVMAKLQTALKVDRLGWLGGVRQAVQEGRLEAALRSAKSGNYSKIVRAFSHLAFYPLDLQFCTIEDLERVPGIGRKTSRFFLQWSGRRQHMAVLDTHILAWLRDRGYDTPATTPQSARAYDRWEQVFLQEAAKLGEHPADLDERIWLERNKSGIRRLGDELPG